MLHGLHGLSGKSPKDEAEFCQVPPVVAVLVKQLLLPLLEQLDGLLALPLQVLDEDFEVLVRVQQVQLVLQIWYLYKYQLLSANMGSKPDRNKFALYRVKFGKIYT